jgi:hypothetical protein
MSPDDEINGAIFQLRRAFERHNVTPAIIELATPHEGQVLLSLLDPLTRGIKELGMDENGEPRHQVVMQGVIVRWPAMMLARPKGGWDYV